MPDKSPPTAFLSLIRGIANGDTRAAGAMLEAEPVLARQHAKAGASRQEATNYFFKSIGHYLYAGDTALHMAAAAYDFEFVRKLIARGADVSAQNRRGAQPLHYAADGRSEMKTPMARRQVRTIAVLIDAGADANAINKDGVAPLHRAVRTRSAAAVKALLENGSDARLKNKSGSTPIHLAVQTTGASGSGTACAREQQRAIVRLLLKYGARPGDKDARGKTARQCATNDVLELFP